MKTYLSSVLYTISFFLFIFLSLGAATTKTTGQAKLKTRFSSALVVSSDTSCIDSVEVYAQGANLTITNVQITANGSTLSHNVNLTNGQSASWGSVAYSTGTTIKVRLTAKSTGSGFKSIGVENPGKCQNSNPAVYTDSISAVKPCGELIIEGSSTANCP